MKKLLFALALLFAPQVAQAQSCPAPAIAYGQVLTAAQWNQQFACKAPIPSGGGGYLPLSGGAMTGPITTVAPIAGAAGFNLPPGTAPTSPNPGDLWATSGGLYFYNGATTVGPLMSAIGTPHILGILKSANFNVTTDQAIALSLPAGATRFFITEIDVVNCSASLTTGAGGFYTAASKGGTVIGSGTTAYTNCASTSTRQRLTGLTNEDTTTFAVSLTTLYLSLTTPQGSAATADVYVYGVPYQ